MSKPNKSFASAQAELLRHALEEQRKADEAARKLEDDLRKDIESLQKTPKSYPEGGIILFLIACLAYAVVLALFGR